MIENRKNILGILNTADIINQEFNNIGFVLIGRRGHGSAEIMSEINKRKRYVNYLGTVDDSDLVRIYNLAFAFFFPSYYEGFGLPPLEAMQVGIPVLISNRSSLPEVVGKGGIIKDADDFKGFADEIIKLYKNPQYYRNMKSAALNQSLNFNQKSAVSELVTTFNELKM